MEEIGRYGTISSYITYNLYGAPDLITDTQLARLIWVGDVQRINGSEMTKKKMDNMSMRKRKVGKPRFI